MTALADTFAEDIRQMVLGTLPFDRKYEPTLRAKGPIELLTIYIDWLKRHIPPRPRNVHQSKALLANPNVADPQFRPALMSIVFQIQTGLNLTPYLSTRIKTGFEQAPLGKSKRLDRRRDLDLLLNDWGIHHLHLSTQLRPGGFVERTKPLLLATFRPDDAYLIDIVDHGQWANDHIVKVMVDEWPDTDVVHRFSGITENSLTNEQRSNLRRWGMNATVEVNGSAYMPSMGTMSSGCSTIAALEGRHIWLSIEQFVSQVERDRGYVAKTLAQHGIIPPPGQNFHFEVFPEGGYGIVECQTGFRFILGK